MALPAPRWWRRLRRAAVATLAVASGTVAVPQLDAPNASALPTCVTTEPISLGTGVNNPAHSPSVSADGRYVAFVTTAALVPSDPADGYPDLYVRDRQAGTFEIVDESSLGLDSPVMTPDGRYIAYIKRNPSGSPRPQVFVHDRATHTTEIVSVSSDELPATHGIYAPAISPDGRYVVFGSFAGNLAPGVSEGNANTYLRDRTLGTTTQASLRNDGGQGTPDNHSGFGQFDDAPSVSADGRYVAFYSSSVDLVAGDTNNRPDVFVRDLVLGTTVKVSVASDGTQANGTSGYPRISPDGRYVAFQSGADNLAPGGQLDTYDVFVRDLQTATTSLVSHNSATAIGSGHSSYYPSMSADGRFVAFISDSPNLVPGDSNNVNDIFVYDRQTGTTTRASVRPDGTESNGPWAGASPPPVISANGQWVVMALGDLMPGDADAVSDVFIRNRSAPTVVAQSPTDLRQAASTSFTIAGSGFQAGATLGAGPGITFSSVSVASSRAASGMASAILDAATGPRGVSVTNPDGCAATLPGALNVIDVTPTLSGTEPSLLHPGRLTVLHVFGTNFDATSAVSFGAGVTALAPTLVSSQELRVEVTVAGDAVLGYRKLTVTNGNGRVAMRPKAVEVQTTDGEFHPLAPARILDTRTGIGGAPGKIGQAQTRNVGVAGAGGVPSTGVSAVVVNVTVTEPAAASFLTVFPSGAPRPVASNLNFTAGQTVPNLATVSVGADGRLNLYNHSGALHAILDVVGWYGDATSAPGSTFHPLTPTRILDTRDLDAPLGPREIGDLDVTVLAGVPTSGVSALVMNVTATQPTAASYLTVWPGDTSVPNASNLNFVAGQTVPNLVVVQVADDGFVSLFNQAGTTHVVADIVGWYDDGTVSGGTRFHGLVPSRILDTREGIGSGGPVQIHSYITLPLFGRGGLPATGVVAAVVNVTATEATAPGYLTVWPTGTPRPLASNLNFTAGQTVPNLVVATTGGFGAVNVYNAFGTVHVVGDVLGWFG